MFALHHHSGWDSASHTKQGATKQLSAGITAFWASQAAPSATDPQEKLSVMPPLSGCSQAAHQACSSSYSQPSSCTAAWCRPVCCCQAAGGFRSSQREPATGDWPGGHCQSPGRCTGRPGAALVWLRLASTASRADHEHHGVLSDEAHKEVCTCAPASVIVWE